MLALNSWPHLSSSAYIKFDLYIPNGWSPVRRRRSRKGRPCSTRKTRQGPRCSARALRCPAKETRLSASPRLLTDQKMPAPQGIGHRIVHGDLSSGTTVSSEGSVLDELNAAVVFCSTAHAIGLAVIRFAQAHFPTLPQVACFDTSFMHTCRTSRAYCRFPARCAQRGRAVRVSRPLLRVDCASAGSALPSKLLIAHLGNGASISGREGRSVDRYEHGIDANWRNHHGDAQRRPLTLVCWFTLQGRRNLDATQLEELVDRRSGLLGVSGVSADLRDLHKVARSDPDARLAIDMFCYRAAKQLAAMSAALGGVDTIIFTGGIGENDAEARALICGHLGVNGVRLDATRNRDATDPISDACRDARYVSCRRRKTSRLPARQWSLC